MEIYFKLKLLNGPLQGHILQLPAETFSIGDGESDLQLQLENGGIATLEVSSEAILLTSGTPCWVNGQSRQPGELPLQIPIDLDGIHFILFRPDDEAANLSVIERRSSWGTSAILMAITFIIAVILCWGMLPAPLPPPESPMAWLTHELKDEPDINVHWNHSKILVISGRCTNSIRLNKILGRLKSDNIHIQVDAVCNDDLTHAIETLMGSYGYQDIVVNVDKKGHAEIDAPLNDNTTYLANDLDNMSGLASWHLSNHGAEQLTLMIPVLRDSGLLEGMSIKQSEHRWILSGQFDEARQLKISALLMLMNDMKDQYMPLQFVGVTGIVRALDYLPAKVASIGGNLDAPYLQLVNGMRLLPGAQIGSGWKIINIFPSGVSLQSSNELRFIPIDNGS